MGASIRRLCQPCGGCELSRPTRREQPPLCSPQRPSPTEDGGAGEALRAGDVPGEGRHAECASPPGVSQARPRLNWAAIWVPALAVLSWGILLTLQECGLHVLGNAKVILLLSCLYFWAWALDLRLFVTPSVATAQKELAFTSRDDVEDLVQHTQRRVDDTTMPGDLTSEQLAAAGWRDNSVPTAGVFQRFQKIPDGRVFVLLDIKTQDQLDRCPLLEVQEGAFAGGAMPIFWYLGNWPEWFPFCQSATLVARLAPDRAIWVLRFKIAFLVVDIVLFCAIIDRLDTEGRIDMIMTSPPAGSEGKSWMGATVPERTAMTRFEMVAYRISMYPHSMESGRVRVHCETEGEMPAKGEWISLLFWRTLSTRVLPLIYKVQAQYAGSALEAYYSSQRGADERQVFMNIAEHMKSYFGNRQIAPPR